MDINDGKSRSSEVRESDDIGNLEGRSRRVGTFQGSSAKDGTDQIATSGEDSYKSNISATGEQSDTSIAGKIIRQLVDETEKQLAYHKSQVETLESRLEELKAVPSDIEKLE
jgi:hypothetical protein